MSGAIQPPQTATATVVSGAAAAFPVSLGYYPQEGSRAIAAQYNWTSLAAYAEDLSQISARGLETTIQGIYVDNSACAQPVTLVLNGSGQVIVCPGYAQGAFPALFTGAQGYQISVPATVVGVTRLLLVNIPFNSSGVWASSSATGLYEATPPELVNLGTTPPLVDAYGSSLVNTEANAPTYQAITNVTAPINATDFFTVYGSASKIIRIHQLQFVLPATAATFEMIRRSTADTGGAFFNVPSVANDPNNAASSAVLSGWTTSPTVLGNSVGNFELWNNPASVNTLTFTYGQTDQSIVLRGVNQGICANLGGGNAAAMFISCKVKWSEV